MIRQELKEQIRLAISTRSPITVLLNNNSTFKAIPDRFITDDESKEETLVFRGDHEVPVADIKFVVTPNVEVFEEAETVERLKLAGADDALEIMGADKVVEQPEQNGVYGTIVAKLGKKNTERLVDAGSKALANLPLTAGLVAVAIALIISGRGDEAVKVLEPLQQDVVPAPAAPQFPDNDLEDQALQRFEDIKERVKRGERGSFIEIDPGVEEPGNEVSPSQEPPGGNSGDQGGTSKATSGMPLAGANGISRPNDRGGLRPRIPDVADSRRRVDLGDLGRANRLG